MCWKYDDARYRELFDWLPWGCLGCFVLVKASAASVGHEEISLSSEWGRADGIVLLGAPETTLLEGVVFNNKDTENLDSQWRAEQMMIQIDEAGRWHEEETL